VIVHLTSEILLAQHNQLLRSWSDGQQPIETSQLKPHPGLRLMARLKSGLPSCRVWYKIWISLRRRSTRFFVAFCFQMERLNKQLWIAPSALVCIFDCPPRATPWADIRRAVGPKKHVSEATARFKSKDMPQKQWHEILDRFRSARLCRPPKKQDLPLRQAQSRDDNTRICTQGQKFIKVRGSTS
jgi:hypothetical protein